MKSVSFGTPMERTTYLEIVKVRVFEDLHDLIEALYFYVTFGASAIFYIMIVQTLRR